MNRRVRPIRTDPPGPILSDESAEAFADVVIGMATEINLAEARCWAEVERLAELGDVAGVLALARRRRSGPPVEVARELDCRPSPAA